MMSKFEQRDIRHELVSELYRLLSVASGEDFIEASMLSVSGNIKLALEALANEHFQSRSPDRKRANNAPPSQRRKERSLEPAGDIARKELSNQRRFPSRQHLLDFAADWNLTVPSDSKAGRERVISSLLRSIENLPEHARLKVLSSLMSSSAEQTEGWLRVIKGKE